MFSPPNSPAVTGWFRRLDAAWKRMPAEEQTRQREEVQQHLEGLVAAKIAQGQPPEDAWNAALVQFGDPTQIGRKMYQEWRQSRTGFRADMEAIIFGCALQAIRMMPHQSYFQSAVFHLPYSFWLFLSGPATTLIGVAIGRKYPYQAIKSALFWPFLWLLGDWIGVAIAVSYSDGRTRLPDGYSLPLLLFDSVSYNGPTIYLSCSAAYLVSVTKRGWYRPTWDDFKVTLPSRRRLVG